MNTLELILGLVCLFLFIYFFKSIVKAILCFILVACIYIGLTYKPQTPVERQREKKEMFRELDNQLADRWGLPIKPEAQPRAEPADDSKPIPRDVDVDANKDGAVRAFLFDGMVCLSKEKFAHGTVKCMDLKTRQSVSINASEIRIPDDAYVDIPVGASVHIFAFQGKRCIAKDKFEKGPKKCWDPKTGKNVTIDTR